MCGSLIPIYMNLSSKKGIGQRFHILHPMSSTLRGAWKVAELSFFDSRISGRSFIFLRVLGFFMQGGEGCKNKKVEVNAFQDPGVTWHQPDGQTGKHAVQLPIHREEREAER